MRIGLTPPTYMAIVFLVVAGCSGRARVSSESARLRNENTDLQRQVAQLESRNRELELELQRSTQASESTSAELRAALPHVTKIEIQRLSFARDTDGDGSVDLLTLYVSAEDGRGRFTQLTGELAARAMWLPVEGEPRVVGGVSLSPVQLRDAYRSSVTGTHYTIEVALDLGQLSSDDPPRDIFARVEYRDGLTGQTLTAERKVALP